MRHATAVILGVLLAGQSVSSAVTVEVQDEASVTGGYVRLGDIALVDGDDTASLRSLAICPSPLADQSVTLSQSRIRRRVAASLGNGDFVLSGAASCRVTRSAVGAAQPKAAAPNGEAGRAANRSLQAVLHEYVRLRLARPADGLRIEFDSRDAALLTLTEAQYQFRIVSAASRVIEGGCAARVEMVDPSRPALVARTAHVCFNVVLVEDVAVAARGIRAGRVIAPEDVRIERREFRTTPRLLLHEARDVVGATARRTVEAGQIIQLEDLAKTLMVRRGDAVTVHIHGRSFSIRTVSRALEGGELGSAVAVQGKDGRGKFYGTVIGPRTVEVRLPGAPLPPANPQTGQAVRMTGEPHDGTAGKGDS